MVAMKQIASGLLLLTVFSMPIALRAAAPRDADEGKALAAATSFLALADAHDCNKAAENAADEQFARVHWPSRAENVTAVAALIFDLPNRWRNYSPSADVTRTLRPNRAKRVTSCQCGIRDGVFYAFTYDVKYVSYDRVLRSHITRPGTDVVYVLQEPDGSWKPAGLSSQYGTPAYGH